MEEKKSGYGYGKKSLWKWIIIYIIAGITVYGLIYYFFFAKKGGYNYNSGSSSQQQNYQYNYK